LCSDFVYKYHSNITMKMNLSSSDDTGDGHNADVDGRVYVK